KQIEVRSKIPSTGGNERNVQNGGQGGREIKGEGYGESEVKSKGKGKDEGEAKRLNELRSFPLPRIQTWFNYLQISLVFLYCSVLGVCLLNTDWMDSDVDVGESRLASIQELPRASASVSAAESPTLSSGSSSFSSSNWDNFV